jgi:tetratricopeptide (TPR) repeat protein
MVKKIKSQKKDKQEEFKQIYDNETKQDEDRQYREQDLENKEMVDKPIPIGTKFSDLYEVISSEQSKGGMGKAILCRGLQDNKYYVLKKAKLKKTELSEAFKKEIEFTLKLDKHPNIVYTQTAIKEEDTFYMVMELVKKQQKHPLKENWWFAKTLTDVIRNNEIDLETAFAWSIEFCRGMQYLNSVGLESHQDIKPENIFITEDNHIKIADFGLASFEGIFYTGGTKKYFSPEHGNKDLKCDIRSDIYSFGIVMYEMFNSIILEKNTKNTGKEVCELIKNKKCKFCSEIIKKSLQEKADNRYQTFLELEEDIAKESKKYFGENFEIENNQMTANDYFSKAKGSELIGNYEQAVELYTKAIKINPRYTDAYYNRGNSQYMLSQCEKAIKNYDRTIELNQKYFFAYRNRGITKKILGKNEEAIKDFDTAIEINPHHIRPYVDRNDILISMGKTKDALDGLNKAIENNPTISSLYEYRAELLKSMGKNEEAVKDYDKAIEYNPTDDVLYKRRVSLLERIGKTKEILNDLNKAIENNPTNSGLYVGRAHLLERIGKTKEALNDLNKAIEFNPTWYTYISRIDLLTSMGKNEEAIKDCDKAIEIDSSDPWAYLHKKYLLKRIRKTNDALNVFNKAIALNPSAFWAYRERATILKDIGKYEEAIKDYNKSIEIGPKTSGAAYAYNQITYCYLYINKTNEKKALGSINKALELAPNDADYIETLGDVYEYIKDYDKAIEQYNKAININKNQRMSYISLIVIYKKLGREKEAKEVENKLNKITKG